MSRSGSTGRPQQRAVQVYVGAGSNIDPMTHLRAACGALRERFGPLTLSSVFRSEPVGFAGEDFLNLVIGFRTTETPLGIVAELERLHRQAGRVRGTDSFASRTLDLDLLLYGDSVIHQPPIHVPRKDIERYAFVLAPLAELAPSLRHPETGRTLADMWADFASGPSLTRVEAHLA